MDDSKPRKGSFYYDLLTFEVEGTLHRVPRSGFETFSTLFADMFQLPQGGSGEGSSDENPIRPPDCTNFEFESLLKVVYPPWGLVKAPAELAKEEWIGVLKLARQWDMPEVSKKAVEALDKADMTDIEKVTLGRRFRIKSWLVDGYNGIAQDPDRFTTDELGKSIGWEAVARLFAISREVYKIAKASSSLRRVSGTEKMIMFRCCGRRLIVVGSEEDPGASGLTSSAWSCSKCGVAKTAWLFPEKVWNGLVDCKEASAIPKAEETMRRVVDMFKEELEEVELYAEHHGTA